MAFIGDLSSGDWRDVRRDGDGGAGPADGFRAEPIGRRDLADLLPSWRALSRTAATPNPFFEDWFLGPALEQFDPDGRVRLATLVEGGELVGLMPLWHDRDYHGRYLPHLAGWQHANQFCGEPLLRRGCEERFWRALLDWADRNERRSLFLHLAAIPEDGSAFASLREVCAREGRPFRIVHSEDRAILNRGLTPQAHLERTVAKKRRKEFARQRRRLEELGQLVFTRRNGAEGLDPWIDDFLALEAEGWKGEEGSALASDPRTAALFRHVLRGAAAAGKLERLAFHLDGRPAAMLCTFVTPPASFSFKTAFDERLARYSPGVLLQLENLALLDRPALLLSDSCAAPGHPMIDQLWSDRRTMVKLSLPVGGRLRRTVGAALTAFEVHRSETNR